MPTNIPTVRFVARVHIVTRTHTLSGCGPIVFDTVNSLRPRNLLSYGYTNVEFVGRGHRVRCKCDGCKVMSQNIFKVRTPLGFTLRTNNHFVTVSHACFLSRARFLLSFSTTKRSHARFPCVSTAFSQNIIVLSFLACPRHAMVVLSRSENQTFIFL